MMPNETRMAYTVGPPLSATEFRFESVPELNYDAAANPPKVGEAVKTNHGQSALLLCAGVRVLPGLLSCRLGLGHLHPIPPNAVCRAATPSICKDTLELHFVLCT